MILGIAPEGTRRRTDFLEVRFYQIALQAVCPWWPAFLTTGPEPAVSGNPYG
jgi:hypothetical protein